MNTSVPFELVSHPSLERKKKDVILIFVNLLSSSVGWLLWFHPLPVCSAAPVSRYDSDVPMTHLIRSCVEPSTMMVEMTYKIR